MNDANVPCRTLRVLIETLWNVNSYQECIPCQTLTCINRNIVECKYDIRNFRSDVKHVLIETLWNVNV